MPTTILYFFWDGFSDVGATTFNKICFQSESQTIPEFDDETFSVPEFSEEDCDCC